MKSIKKNIIHSTIILTTLLYSCQGYLDRTPLDGPTSETFLSKKSEINLAIVDLYRFFYWEADYGLYNYYLDGASDNAWIRTFGGNMQAVGNGQASPSTLAFEQTWKHHYKYIQKANYIINNLSRASLTDAEKNNYLGQAKFIRAFAYTRLTLLYGNVPYTDKTLDHLDETLTNTPKSEINSKILADLDEAIDMLPDNPANKQRISKWAGLALKARFCLYNELYEEAERATKEIMDNGNFVLHPDYGKLFSYEGINHQEVILNTSFHPLVKFNRVPQVLFGRNFGGWSIVVPSQFLVDSYECTDGKTIDDSPLYINSKSYENRDPRLKASIVTSRSPYFDTTFSVHPGDEKTKKTVAGKEIEIVNADVTNPYATFTGYLWHKYADANDIGKTVTSTLGFIMFRYAEVLLTYAEAMIEQNKIDQSVLVAINRVRARAYKVDVASADSYPNITTTNQEELRKIVRRERRVELAGEGLRLYDIRRWEIAHLVMPGIFPGRRKVDNLDNPEIPNLSAGYPVYTDILGSFKKLEDRNFDSYQYLWPIPQSELNVNKNIKQHDGY